MKPDFNMAVSKIGSKIHMYQMKWFNNGHHKKGKKKTDILALLLVKFLYT